MEAATSYSMKNLSSKKLQMNKTKKQKEEAEREKKGDQEKEQQIEATVHFWSRAFVQEIPRK